MKKELKVPKFNSEDEEFKYWVNLDLSEYFEPSDFIPVQFPNLKYSIKKPQKPASHPKQRAYSHLH